MVDETYNLPLSDATPLVSKARVKGAEILCCLSFFDDAVMIMRAAKAMNYNPKLIFQQAVATLPAWMKELGEDGNYVTNSAFWSPELPYPGNKEINEAAKLRLGIPCSPDPFWIFLRLDEDFGVGRKRSRNTGRQENQRLPSITQVRPPVREGDHV